VRRLARSAVAALAGVGAGLAFEPYHWVYLLPVAVAVLTLLCAGRPVRSGFGLGFVFGTAFMLVLLPWLQVIGVYAWVPLALLEGLFYGVAGLVTSAVAGPVVRLRWWPVWTAGAWVLLEWLRGTVPFGGFPWGRLAFAVEDTPVAPALAYVGAAGVTFLVALVGTTLAWAVWRLRRAPVRSLVGLAAAVAVACVASVVPWQATRSTDPQVRVAAVQGNVPGEGLDAFVERRLVLDNHVEATQQLAARVDAGRLPRPDLVIWPENSSDIDPYTDAAARTAIGDAAVEVGAPLLMGAVVGDRTDGGWYNRAIVWSATGRPGAYYDKTHPVPFGEYIPLRSFLASRIPALRMIPNDMVPGTRPGVLQVGPAHTGVLMCFEVAYDGLLRDLVDGGADIIVVPTNNATYTGTGQVEQQFAMSRLRAIETGRTVVVASTNGISGVVAPDGRVVARAPERRQVVLDREVTLVSRRTPATQLGRWPELALSGVTLLALLVGLVTGRRRTGRDTPPSERPTTPQSGSPTAHPGPGRGDEPISDPSGRPAPGRPGGRPEKVG
jgi:apolipoprotein N-acyltransferase